MKKILSVVLTLVMVLSTFAMIVPTASAATSTNEVFYENDFSNAAYAGKTDADLADAIFGAGNHNTTAQGAKLSIVNGALKIDTTAAGKDFFNMVLSTDADISDGYIAELDYTFHEYASSSSNNGRFVTFGSHAADNNAWANMTVVGPYDYGNGSSPNARVGSRPAGAWKGWTSTYKPTTNVNDWDTTYRMRATIKLNEAILEVAKYTDGVLGDYVTIASTTDVHPAQTLLDLLTLTIQKQLVVTVDNVKVISVNAANFPEAPAVTTSAGKVLYSEDFSNAAYAGKTGAELADAIFGAGNHCVTEMQAGVSIVDGALKLDATPAGADFLNLVLSTDAVVSEGYVAEMDYTFHDNSTADRLITFGNKPAVHNVWTDMFVVGPYYQGRNASIAWRNGASGNAWTGHTSAQNGVTADQLNTAGTTYRMRSTITPNTLKLEVAKYTDGVLGDYVVVGEYENTGSVRNMKDIVSLSLQKGVCATVDNIVVTSLTSTPLNVLAGYQDSANALRLVGALDAVTKENATAVGFEVAILGMGELKSLECTYVYETIDGNAAASLNAGSDYLYAMHIEQIPAGEYSIMVVPYYVQGGATVYGAAKTFLVTIEDAE